MAQQQEDAVERGDERTSDESKSLERAAGVTYSGNGAATKQNTGQKQTLLELSKEPSKLTALVALRLWPSWF